jgi:UDP-4-amino-4,6-dideoxy-N-acetyl-beta-L-altrosamine N-acetyltransferase
MIDLREVAEQDSERLFLWRRRPVVDRWMQGAPFPTLDRHERWFEALRADPDRRAWIITVGSRPAGLLTLGGISSGDRRGEWGWYIGEDWARGTGVGRAAQVLGLDLAFGPFGLEKVVSDVLADNEAALKVQAAAGFRREGYLRAHLIKDGRRRDVVRLGLLAPEWAERRAGVAAELRALGLLPPPGVNEP